MSAQSRQPDDDTAARSSHESASGVVAKPVLDAAPVAKRGGIYTINAQEGLDAAVLVNAALGRKSVGKQTPRRLEVLPPDGPSTAGGKRARQTLRLVPLQGETGPVMCGYLDVSQKVVELRSHDTVLQLYEARFGVPCDIQPDEYATLCRELQMVLTPFRYTFSFAEQSVAALRPGALQHASHRVVEGKSSTLSVVLVSLFVLFAAGFAITFLR